ncbi:alkaline phosphatase [Aureispira sp. CCB-E]|uniref:alkaline phosphatase n=1 Tax=Aureispira sp. CCB-E TaxID=3051121 RepID=UPI002868BAA3|nr:alkaline phosphatase [Aureispira sp. CCB-E]WMX14785.1 alkaline phosphatase [Aureispira sp. CCB-E]
MNKLVIIVFFIWISSSCETPQALNNASNEDENQPQEGTKEAGKTFIAGKRPKNVIFLIGDGMGLTQITAGSIAKKTPLILEKFRQIGLVKTYSTKLITDSAAGATAMATGSKTYNGAISMNIHQKKLKTILEYAEEKNWLTGIVTTATVTHATPACFYGHQPTRSRVNQKLAAEFMTKDIEVLMGGGWNYFKDGLDGRDLIAEAQEKGYFVTDNIEQVGDYRPEKMICLISAKLPPKIEERGDFLPLAAKKAIDILSYPKSNFFLMIEGAQIDWGGHKNESDYIVEEMLDFDRTIQQAFDFAKKDGNTLVIVTADHETGGYSINGGSKKEGKVEGKFTSDYHTATMVPIFAYGPGAESFTGIMDNTEIFFKLKYLMNLSESSSN